ncbi:putative NAD-dependent epimerase/dehydratase [Magnetofaba australis IT-1]|uniref:Putative NAD-dependent epimerase/dehydratase n=1 Tax=Magnetofaba australis IT-1 TaxID=1434232 RepID=A0A1Y2K4G7_9PROT|nr:putative NAD-dependent epimerase/dehydratase [Magnetofaba australis IT-1]
MVLVTGGAGFIGSNFVRHMLRERPDDRIIVLDALTYAGSLDNLPDAFKRPAADSRATFHYGDVCNPQLVAELVAQSDQIVHFAAESHVSRSIVDNWSGAQTNFLGAQNLINALLKSAPRVERMIHISSSEVYGDALTERMDETHPLNPKSPYAAAKCGADRLVYAYCATHDLPIVTLRPFNAYGPRQHVEKAIPRFITHALREQPLPIHGSGEAMRDFLHVADLCRAIDLTLQAPLAQTRGQIYNVASGAARSVVSIAQEILHAMGAPAQALAHTVDRPGQVARHTGDFSKIHRALGWSPTIDWESGLRETIAWYQAHAELWRKQLILSTQRIPRTDGQAALH